MPKILVFQHVPFEPLGTLNPLIKQAGVRIRYVNFGRKHHEDVSFDGYDGLVILGGPMNVGQAADFPHLQTEIRLIEEALRRELPILGICLGAQLIAHTLGAGVRKNPEKEIGWYEVKVTKAGQEDPLFSHFEPSEKIFQWHGDTFDIPKTAVHLAETDTCSNQAFRYNKNVYGFQFHMEVDESLVHRWLNVPIYKTEIASTNGLICPEQIRVETAANIARLQQISSQTFAEFFKHLGDFNKFRRLPSR